MPSVPSEKLDEARTLIRNAFEAAARKGKPAEMTSAVLKNRLLQAKPDFKEADYGASRFVEFVALFNDLVSIDATQNPPLVRFLSAGKASFVPSGRLRSDLWRALVDHRGSLRYVWDAGQGIARPVGAGETGPFLPTLTEDDLKALRRKFVDAEKPGLGSEDSTHLADWEAQGLTNRALPPALQGRWNGVVKREIVGRLEKWFAEAHLPLPQLFADARSAPVEPSRKPTSSLHDFVRRCIEEMSDAQLSQLAIPAEIAFRVSNAR